MKYGNRYITDTTKFSEGMQRGVCEDIKIASSVKIERGRTLGSVFGQSSQFIRQNIKGKIRDSANGGAFCRNRSAHSTREAAIRNPESKKLPGFDDISVEL